MIVCCKDCKDRHTLCWSDCEKYLKQKKEYEQLKEARLKFINTSTQINQVLCKRRASMSRKKGGE